MVFRLPPDRIARQRFTATVLSCCFPPGAAASKLSIKQSAKTPASRFRALCVLGTRRSRRGASCNLRASCPALWRGLVVPDLSGLVTHRGRKCTCRSDNHGTGDRDQTSKRKRRARPVPCAFRAGRHVGG